MAGPVLGWPTNAPCMDDSIVGRYVTDKDERFVIRCGKLVT